jgi:tetratricopeptide (TPR) repeat protein
MEVDQSPATAAAASRESATAAYKRGAYAEAVTLYTSALAALGSSDALTSSALLANRAAAHLMLKRHSLASEDCATALALDPTNVKAMMRKASTDLALGDAESAIALYANVLSADPTNAAAKKERAVAQTAWKRLSEARGAATAGDLDRVLLLTGQLAESCPTANEVKMLRSSALLGLSRFDEAFELTTEMMQAGAADAAPVLILRARILNFQVRCVAGRAPAVRVRPS